MSLAPSNMIAEETNGGTRVFPNLARQIRTYAQMPSAISLKRDGTVERDEKSSGMGEVLIPGAAEIVKDITQIVRAELVAAGIPGEMDREGRLGCYDLALGGLDWVKGEVPTGLVGFFNKWKFERRWYYYAAEGAGIPPEFAVPFDREWGKEARVNGDCACRGAEFWGEGFAISNYHIDTPQGLKAFVELLAKIYAPRREDG